MNYELMCCLKAYRGKKSLDLQEANLRGVNLQWADLQWANLRGADLQEANLQWAKLQEANLRGANLRGADLQEAILPNSICILQAGRFTVFINKCGLIRIGCCEKSLEVWIKLSDDQLMRIDTEAVAWKREYGSFVIEIAEKFIENKTV